MEYPLSNQRFITMVENFWIVGNDVVVRDLHNFIR